MLKRNRLILVDQLSFSELAPRWGERSPYIDDRRLVEQLELRL